MDITFTESDPAPFTSAEWAVTEGDTFWRAEHTADDGKRWAGIGPTRDDAEMNLLSAMLYETGGLPGNGMGRLTGLLNDRVAGGAFTVAEN